MKHDDLVDYDESILTLDGHESALIGVVRRMGQPAIACYNLERVVQNLEDQGMSNEEAQEFFEYNIIGSWVGEYTPCFLELPLDLEISKITEEIP